MSARSAAVAGGASVVASRDRPYGLVRADWLKLWKRRGMVWTVFGMTVGVEILIFGVPTILHAVNPAHHHPAGGIENLGHGILILNLLGAVAATVVGASAGSADLRVGVFRELVVTGRSRLELFAARIPGGLAFLLPFTAVAYAFAAIGSRLGASGSVAAPSVALLIESGLWVFAETAFYFLVSLGVASFTGSRTFTIGIVLAWRLIVARIIASIGLLGVFREIVPDVHFSRFAPAALGHSVRETATVPTSLAASIAALLLWIAVWLVLGAWRTVTGEA
jgi:hypothetical protein